MLQEIDTVLWKRERERAAQSLDEAAGQMRLLLREQFLQIIKAFRAVVEPDKQGQTRKFSARMINRLRSFREQF